MNMINNCELYKNGMCHKGLKERKCKQFFIKDLGRTEEQDFLPENKMCERESIFGGYGIALTDKDIERLKKGKEVIHLIDEYSFFIGYVGSEHNATKEC